MDNGLQPTLGPDRPTRTRGWVWHSSLASRAASQISVLACAETVGAVALYWWIAFRYDTHWHLVSSVFIAPFLLLRSPDSIAAGVRWFAKDWLRLANYDLWSNLRAAIWFGTMALGSVIGSFFVARSVIHDGMSGLERWPLLGWAAFIGALAVSTAFALASAFMVAFADVLTGAVAEGLKGPVVMGMSELEGKEEGAIVVALSSAVALKGALAGAFSAAIVAAGTTVFSAVVSVLTVFCMAGAGAGLGTIVGLVSGIALRSFFFRVLATLRYLSAGFRQLPKNWRENNFLTDSCLPPELMPGIRDSLPILALDGLTKSMHHSKGMFKLGAYPLMATCFFLPAFLYRLNIKATAWFWWPLAYLLKPPPVAEVEGQQKQALCFPWTDPFQKCVTGLSVLLVLVSLVDRYVDWNAMADMESLPALLPLKVFLAIRWEQIAPWHWAQWIMAGAGLGMFALAGHARSHDLAGNWAAYYPKCSWHLDLMTALRRLRYLAFVALLLMVFGALLLHDGIWLAYFSVPETWITALKRFYRIP